MSIILKDTSLKNSTSGNFTYRDVNLNLNGRQPVTSVVVDDLFAITESMRNILTIKKGSRFLNRSFGNELSEYMFEPITEELGKSLGDDLAETLKQETRIVVQEVNVTVDKAEGIYELDIIFTVPTLSQSDISMQVDFAMNQGLTF